MPVSQKPRNKKLFKPYYTKYRGLWIQRVHDRFFIKKQKRSHKIYLIPYKLVTLKQAKRFIAEELCPST